MSVLGDDLCAWLGLAMPGMLAITTPSREPRSIRAWAVRRVAARDTLEVVVLDGVEPALEEALQSSGRAALTLIELPSYRSRMFKGTCSVDPSPVSQAYVRDRLAALEVVFATVGMPAGSTDIMLDAIGPTRSWRSILLEVDAVFDQSPRAGAGARL